MRVIVALPLLTLCACGVLTWKSVYSSTAPGGKAEVRVQESGCFADCAVQIIVKTGWHSQRIASKTDCVIYFAHAAWFGSKVGVFVDGSYCGTIKVAFDTSSGQVVDFKTVEEGLKTDIIKSYRVTSDELQISRGDVFTWASYPGDGNRHRAMDEFRQRQRTW